MALQLQIHFPCIISLLLLVYSKSVFSTVSTQCGEILGGDERFGQIAYKAGPNETYESNERCMWTIRIPSADKIIFDLEYSGMVDTVDIILVLAINSTSPGRSFVINATNSEQLTIDANLAVVTFFSGALNNGRGFILNYTGIGESTHGISNRSRDFMLTEAGSLKYPQDQEFYDSNEVSTFLLNTVGFKDNYTHIGTFNLTIEGLEPGTDGCDHDYIVLRFLPFSGSWVYNKVYCDDDIFNEPFPYPFPVLMSFHSDSMETNGRGFKLDWEYIRNGIQLAGGQEKQRKLD